MRCCWLYALGGPLLQLSKIYAAQRGIRVGRKEEKQEILTTYEKRILRVLDHIHANPAGDLSLDALADVAAFNRFHWHRVFHAATGETLADAVRRIRLHRSACWLVQTEKPMADVAALSGFANARTFDRVFRQAYSISPSAFRKQGKLGSPDHPNRKGNPPMFTVEIVTAPARRLIAVPHRGSYMHIAKAFEALGTIIAARNLWNHTQGMIGVYYDDPSATKEALLHSHAGLVVSADLPSVEGLEDVFLPGGRIAVLRFKGHYSGLPAAYQHLYGSWLPASGQDAANAPVFEHYLNSPSDTAPENLLTEICLPLASP